MIPGIIAQVLPFPFNTWRDQSPHKGHYTPGVWTPGSRKALAKKNIWFVHYHRYRKLAMVKSSCIKTWESHLPPLLEGKMMDGEDRRGMPISLQQWLHWGLSGWAPVKSCLLKKIPHCPILLSTLSNLLLLSLPLWSAFSSGQKYLQTRSKFQRVFASWVNVGKLVFSPSAFPLIQHEHNDSQLWRITELTIYHKNAWCAVNT